MYDYLMGEFTNYNSYEVKFLTNLNRVLGLLFNLGSADFSKRIKDVQRLQVDTFFGLRSDNNLKSLRGPQDVRKVRDMAVF
ncbi:hypothetical protein MNBD_BACTEROID03-1322 [hydrothermal vent metagenome]|uniref:Uncharacterized protein n=1 Tax=hydrothermal vent metagenome TaxID=652676 RepID=A0A3B0UG40_9ZZZZ